MKPKIGVLARPMISSSGRKIYGTYQEIHDVILSFGGIPVQLFPPNKESYFGVSYESLGPLSEEEKQDIHCMIDECDGILLQGGTDFYPYDIETARYAYEKDIPTLGICLGMQTMGYAIKGEMGHVKDKVRHQNKQPYSHDILLNKKSKLFEILNEEKIHVNSRHQDCLIDTSLQISARSDDGVIEAIEDIQKNFYIGVQWHPESMLAYNERMNLIFKEFISCVIKNRNKYFYKEEN